MLPNTEVYIKSLIPLGLIALLAEAIWLMGPYLAWADYAPLAQPEKRIYIILFLFLAWLLKFLIVDLDTPNPHTYKDPKLREKLQELQNRFYGALQFLQKTTLTKQGKAINLDKLPWYLLIGPAHSGKTTLLAHSNINFILQRQFPKKDKLEIEPSENCDWWVTREASIVDVPAKYFITEKTTQAKSNNEPVIWQFFLRLIRKQRGKEGINGFIITLPLPDLMKQNDTKAYQAMALDLFQQLREYQNFFQAKVPCQLIITKCDLLPGFTEFFSESNNDELTQAWGIGLSKPDEKIHDVFAHRFDMLIKKLNQQLLWRLHQERNPMARPYIKDFPLQVERTKEFLIDFIKKFTSARLNLSLQGVYLTSALQPKPEVETVLDQAINSSARSVQLFKEPSPDARAYFIKQLFTHVFSHGLPSISIEDTLPLFHIRQWKRYTAYLASAGIITLVAAFLGRDFQQGIKQAYAIQHNLSDYHLSINQIHDPDQRLERTLTLLNSLHQSVKETGFKLDLAHLMSFYSNKSQQKTNEVYQQALHTLLLPEIKNYIEYYLQNPVNKNADDVYSVLKAYLMLGDAFHYDSLYVTKIMEQIQPKIIREAEQNTLMQHVTLTLNSAFSPLPLDAKTIQETRQFLVALPGLNLSYIILKNLNSNSSASEINIGTNTNIGDKPIFVSQQMLNQIPIMFTVKAFSTIFSQEINTAAQEATLGNWVLGNDTAMIKNPVLSDTLTEQLRTTYVNNYIDAWEKMLADIHLAQPNDLAETDALIINLTSTNSPLLQLLQTLHENTYFEPITSLSPKLQNLGQLLEKNAPSQNQLYEIFAGLQALHQYLQTTLTAENMKKAAFETVSQRMANHGTPDAITQLRIIAQKNPDPIKFWLDKIADDSWRFLMKEAGHYLDTSWQNQVIRYYAADIADRYPFNADTEQEVTIQKFIHFFGNPGIVLNFYNNYLHSFIDTSMSDWRWKKIDNQKLAFSDVTLRQIQHAMRIHHSFFPNADNKLNIQFALQPYKFGNNIKRVKLSINDKQFIDDQTNLKSSNSHVVAWPSNFNHRMTFLQLTLSNQQTVNRRFPGDWGWFKLVNQSFESMINKKEMLVNFSQDEYPAKYLLFTESQYNPFLSLNLKHFHLSQQLTDTPT